MCKRLHGRCWTGLQRNIRTCRKAVHLSPRSCHQRWWRLAPYSHRYQDSLPESNSTLKEPIHMAMPKFVFEYYQTKYGMFQGKTYEEANVALAKAHQVYLWTKASRQRLVQNNWSLHHQSRLQALCSRSMHICQRQSTRQRRHSLIRRRHANRRKAHGRSIQNQKTHRRRIQNVGTKSISVSRH